MNRSRVSRVLLPALAAGAMLIATPGASARAPRSSARPGLQPQRRQNWLYYITGLGLGAIAVGLTIMPSRRTHQD
ncbi:MAG: hypothetical protein R3B46_08610 [Phycisphaerales bacterium]